MQARVLVVDDEAVARNLYSDVLVAAGHTVRAVPNADEALAAFAVEPYDVLVTDLILPGKDGLQFLSEAKGLWPNLEIIVVTGLEKVEPAVRALKNGASEYLVKPLAPEVLQAAVSRCLLTKRLLNENNALRAHVALLEAGQKIATTLDRNLLYPLALEALHRELSPKASCMLVQSTGALRAVFSRELDEAESPRLAEELIAELPLAGEGSAARIELGGRKTLVFTAAEGSELLGALVAVEPERFDGPALAAGTFLASHVGLALRNSGRIAAVEDLAYQDDLTHLFNTRYLHLVLDREIRSSMSTGDPLALLFIDLDRFKQVNDRHGHLVGSKLLCEVARVLKSCVRDCDVVVRYGGDEYVVLLVGTDSGGAVKVAERIRRTIESHPFLSHEGLAVRLSTCIGVASFPEHAADKQSLLQLADVALYRGKRTTRNVVYVAALDSEPQTA